MLLRNGGSSLYNMAPYQTLPLRHERVKRQAPVVVNGKRRKEKQGSAVPMDPVESNKKASMSLDPSQFSSVLQGVFEAWYKQRFEPQKKKKATVETTPAPTTRPSGIDKKALFNEFLKLAMDYFKPQDKKKVKPKKKQAKVTIPPKGRKKTKRKKASASNTKKVTRPPKTTTTKITHPPVLTRKNTPKPEPKPQPAAESPSAEEVIVEGQGSGTTQQSAEPVQPVPTKPPKPKGKKKPQPPPQREGPQVDPELLGEINELRVMQGLPELRADQVDQYGNILPKYTPPPPPSSPHRSRERHGHDSHGHSHGPHDHYHDHSHGHDPYSLGFGAESYIQSSLRDTHARAHQIAGHLSPSTHRELHRLLRDRENSMRRDAWQTRRLRQELFGGGPVLRAAVDVGDFGDLGI